MVSYLKTLAHKGCKIAATFFLSFFIDFFFICPLRLDFFLPPLPKIQCQNILDFWNPWGKSNTRSGFSFKNFFIKGVKSLAGFFWYRCYYSHWSRDSLSSVCMIFAFGFVCRLGSRFSHTSSGYFQVNLNCKIKKILSQFLCIVRSINYLVFVQSLRRYSNSWIVVVSVTHDYLMNSITRTFTTPINQ